MKGKRTKKFGSKTVIYHADTTSIVSEPYYYNICYSWQKPVEEPTNKEVLVHIKVEG